MAVMRQFDAHFLLLFLLLDPLANFSTDFFPLRSFPLPVVSLNFKDTARGSNALFSHCALSMGFFHEAHFGMMVRNNLVKI